MSKRILSTILILLMILLSSVTSVLAEGEETVQPETDVNTEVSSEQNETPYEGDVSEQNDALSEEEVLPEDTSKENTEFESDVNGSEPEESKDAKLMSVDTEEKSNYDINVDVTFSGTRAFIKLSGTDAGLASKVVIIDGYLGAVEASKTTSTLYETVNMREGNIYKIAILNNHGESLKYIEYDTTKKELTAPEHVKAIPGYHSVTVYWDEVEAADHYEVYRSGNLLKRVNASKTSYRDKTAKEGKEYKYYVVAVKGSERSERSAVKKAGRVRTARYRITFKSSVKLTSHDGYGKTMTFRGGQTVHADGFSQGKYQFNYKGYRFYAMWMRIKNAKGQIKANAYQNGGLTATNYVNEGGYSSSTDYLIWVNLYSQRVFIYRGYRGHWKLIRDWQCGSGKAKSPTPTGMNKRLHAKYKHYSRHKWWNCFSGTNAIHGSNGAREEAKLGTLVSGGCVRVKNSQAKWIFNNIPKGTRIMIF